MNILYRDLVKHQQILNDLLANKAGVYELVHLETLNNYIGSSSNLKRRFNEYLNSQYIERNLAKGNSRILNALKKYGPENFGIRILEFIDIQDIEDKVEIRQTILEREQYYLDHLTHVYNLNKFAGSNLGRTYSPKVRQKMSLAKIGKPSNKLGKKLSPATCKHFSEYSVLRKSIQKFNENGELLMNYCSITDAANQTGLGRKKITNNLYGVTKFVKLNGNKYVFKFGD